MSAERRAWSAEQDQLLRLVFDTSVQRKWSHMARRLQEEFGVRGRNGKQCRERYLSCIDGSLRREDWSYEEEQRLIELHNQLGNKWAVIGSTLGHRNDNAVKNHFYSRLRKALKKVNQALLASAVKPKEFKPNVLYRIVEVAEETFKTNPTFDRHFSLVANQLKNDLFDLAYDDEVEEVAEGEVDEELASSLISRLAEFTANYKRKPKKARRESGTAEQLLAPARSRQEDSDPLPSSETSNFEGSNEEAATQQHSKRSRRSSAETTANLQILERIRTRAHSQGTQPAAVPESEQSKVTQETESLENALEGLQIIEVQALLPPYPPMLRRESSRFSRAEGEEEFRFFEDSQIEMRILPEVDFAFRRESSEDPFFL